jgi:hypothetical protein
MSIQVVSAIESIEKCLREADTQYLQGCYNYNHDEDNYDHDYAMYYVELAFIELLILLEHLGLNATYQQVDLLYQSAKKGNFLQSKMGPEEPYLLWCEKIRMYVDGISGVHGLGETSASEIRDLKSILKRALYFICNTSLFTHLPGNEADVHDRLEGILKCHYSDLKRKPSLSKPIKNFEPDTGIPSSKTLIEYKFVSTKTEAKRVVDEILADVSGYRSSHWKNLLFVIYETHRVMPEEEWKSLLKECELGSNYDAIVLSGDAKPATKGKKNVQQAPGPAKKQVGQSKLH